jgi:RNA polymerase sigma-70 factor (ECF subfamily)
VGAPSHQRDSDDQAERAAFARLRTGDPTGFDELYARHHRNLYSFLVRLSGRVSLAQDLCQETWMAFAVKAGGLDPQTHVRAWLLTVARHAYVDQWRRHHRFGDEAGAEDVADFATSALSASPEHGVFLSEVERALFALPLADRELLLLVGVEGLRQDHVAAMLNLEPATVRQRLTRARMRLANLLAPEPHDKGERR